MNLHDFVKKNYEEGNYDRYKKYYQNKDYYKQYYQNRDDYKKYYQNEDYYKQYYQNKDYYKQYYQSEDFYMGYNQAFDDYKKHGQFRHYPKKMIYLFNILFKDKAIEILNFINGYVYAKNYIKDNLK